MSQLTDWIVKNTGTLCIGAMVGVSMVLPAGAMAQEPPKPPTCEERLAVTGVYADLLRQVRDQYEQKVAELAAKVQALEKGAAPKPSPAK